MKTNWNLIPAFAADLCIGAITAWPQTCNALTFLALENAPINNDDYWVRASDYNLYLDAPGRFHIIHHDVNETFAPSGVPGRVGPECGHSPKIRQIPIPDTQR